MGAKLTTQQYVTQWLKFVRNLLESSYYITNINIRLKRTIIQGPWEGSKTLIFVMLSECNEEFLEDGKLSMCVYACVCVGVYEEL
jgi:hypothetical protein